MKFTNLRDTMYQAVVIYPIGIHKIIGYYNHSGNARQACRKWLRKYDSDNNYYFIVRKFVYKGEC